MAEMSRAPQFHGLELEVRAFGGAKAARVLHAANQKIDVHEHDWACITIPVLGAAREVFDGGETELGGPSAVLHPAGRCHGDDVGSKGLETFSIQFDPAWLGSELKGQMDQSSAWVGGRAALLASRLAWSWRQPHLQESELKAATHQFIWEALATSPSEAPPWLQSVHKDVLARTPLSTSELARKADLHPAWLARCYRRTVGESLKDTRRRCRVEVAVELLRASGQALSEVAAAAGFADQSHMNRNFSELLGRTPLQVRKEGQLLRRMIS
jgi:AraC-like DNA-binding protein